MTRRDCSQRGVAYKPGRRKPGVKLEDSWLFTHSKFAGDAPALRAHIEKLRGRK